MKRNHRTFAITAALALAVATVSMANTTNTVPAYFSFEDQAVDTSVVGSNGWYADNTNAGIIIDNPDNYPGSFPPGFPIATNHTQVLEISDTLTNMVSSLEGEKVFVDTMISPRPWDQDDAPTIPADAQMAAYVSTNQSLVVWHADYDTSSNMWTELTSTTVPTGTWIRLTFEMNYSDFDGIFAYYFYRVLLNGVEVSDPAGRSQPDQNGTAGGPWFPMPDSTQPFISSLTINGTGMIDDLQFVPSDPNNAVFYSVVASVDDSDAAILTPSGTVNVTESNDLKFVWSAKNGYSVTNVLVDGVLLNPATNTYTFVAVTENHTLTVLTDVLQGISDMGVPLSWYTAYGIDDGDMGNKDADPTLNWEEYVAGTDPTNELSFFQILAQGHGSPSNYVSYYCSTNSGLTEPVDIYRSSDLLDANGWVLVGDNVPRADDGTNTWWDVNAPSNLPAFYRPTILWVTP